MPANMFYAEEGSIIMSGCETFGTASGVDFSAQVREISISGGGRDVDLVRCFGNKSYFDEKPQEPFECVLTIVKKDSDLASMLLEGTDVTGPRAWSGDTYPRKQDRTLIYKWCDATNVSGPAVRITFASVFATGKEMTLNATDHLEETVTFKCLPKNYKEEATVNMVASALP